MTRMSSTIADSGWLSAPSPHYLDQPAVLEEAPMPPLVLTATITIAAIVAAFTVWAALTPVDELASAQGQVIPNGYVQSVQHPDGGIVREIDVEDGQLVEKGQILLRLDGTNAKADLGQMTARQKALQLQATRLQQFATGETDGELTEGEASILQSMEEARASQRNILNTQIMQKRQELRALGNSLVAFQKDRGIVEKQYAMHHDMAQRGIGSQLMALESERQLNQIKAQISETLIQQTRARDAIAEAQNRLESLDAELKQDAMKTYGQVQAELDEINNTIAKAAATAERTVVVSPVRGLVKGLSVHTLGAVIEPGKVLMEIVPVEKELVVEAMVSPKDVGHLREGQPVNVKISAFDFARYGNVEGKLRGVSASSFQTEEGESYYKVKIGLEKNYVGHNSKHNIILPGMTVQADIVTGSKTVLDYLLKPIHVAKETAFSEN